MNIVALRWVYIARARRWGTSHGNICCLPALLFPQCRCISLSKRSVN